MKASDAALPMWADFLKQALELRPELGGGTFKKPVGIVTVEIDPTTGCLAAPDSTLHRTEMFIAGTEPTFQCSASSNEQDSEEVTEPEDGEETLDNSKTPAAEEAEEGQVTVDLCSLTGLLATRSCPRTEKRTFPADKIPTVACSPDFHRDN
jgi:membrane carboxypeptidase/penicillin-binding protein